MKSIAILCGGGPAPGINCVVATVTKVFLKAGYRVLGIHEGYKGLLSLNPNIEELTYEKADHIYPLGGSALVMSRFKPKDSDFRKDFFINNDVELLVTIGGDDTASTANRLTKYLSANNINVRNIHVPKTIDNDLPLPAGVPTFGFMSAREMGISIGKIIKSEAATTKNWYLLMSMGREAGHLAYEIAKGIHADTVVIPEMFPDGKITIEKVVRLVVSGIIKSIMSGRNGGVVVLSEGIFHYFADEDVASCGIKFSYDEHGHPELSNVSKAHIINTLVQDRLKKEQVKITCRAIEVGYSLRCVEPCAYDLNYCTTLGAGVKKLYESGCTGCMVAMDNKGQIVPIYLKDVEDENGKIRPRLVDLNNPEAQYIHKEMFSYLYSEDIERAKAYIGHTEEYNSEIILG